jgi:hypothetical protein
LMATWISIALDCVLGSGNQAAKAVSKAVRQQGSKTGIEKR